MIPIPSTAVFTKQEVIELATTAQQRLRKDVNDHKLHLKDYNRNKIVVIAVGIILGLVALFVILSSQGKLRGSLNILSQWEKPGTSGGSILLVFSVLSVLGWIVYKKGHLAKEKEILICSDGDMARVEEVRLQGTPGHENLWAFMRFEEFYALEQDHSTFDICSGDIRIMSASVPKNDGYNPTGSFRSKPLDKEEFKARILKGERPHSYQHKVRLTSSR